MSSLKSKSGSRVARGSVTPKIMEQISSIIKSTFHGNVTLVTQDFRIVQIERNEKIRPYDSKTKANEVSVLQDKQDFSAIQSKIRESCETLEFGQVVIVIKEGRVVQIDRTEKQRFSNLIGVYGDGI